MAKAQDIIALGLAVMVVMEVQAKLVKVKDINPQIRLDIRYATTNNFTGKKVYPSADCYLVKSAAHALDKIQQELEHEGLGLKVFDGYRPLSVQRIFWTAASNRFPDENERQQYVANPQKGSKHNRGTAVDATLIERATGKELAMPSDYDDFSEKAHRTYEKMASDEIRKNCQKLEDIMKKHGFVPVQSEWWHFDFAGWEKYPIQDISFDQLEKESGKP